MIRRLTPVWAALAVTIALVVTAAAPAEPAPISLGVAYTQNFDSLASSGTSSVAPDWLGLRRDEHEREHHLHGRNRFRHRW